MRRGTALRFAVVVALLGVAGPTFAGDEHAPATNEGATDRVATTPDISQLQDVFPRSGKSYCGPTAASNALVYLSRNGFENLVSGDQIALAQELGSAACMQTGPSSGTGPTGVINGLKAYVAARGYEVAEIDYQGWRSVPRELSGPKGVGEAGHADPARAVAGLREGGAVLLHVGWYAREQMDAGPAFRRVGGHWVTLVGGDGDGFVIHDPADLSITKEPARPRSARVTVVPVAAGTIVNKEGKAQADAAGASELGGELRIAHERGRDTALLDGVLVFQLKK